MTHPNPLAGPPPSPSPRRVRRNAAQWADLIAQQAASGLDVAAFCDQHHLGVSGFYAWRRRLASATAPHAPNSDPPPAKDPPRFLKLEPSAAPDVSPLTVTFPNGVTLTAPPDALRPLVAALRESAPC